MAQAKHRSPNYPRLAFDAAIEKVRIVYQEQHKHAASKDVIAQALGYTKSSTGTSKAVIASLGYYRMLEPAGDGVRVSADAIRVPELPNDDPERTEALLRMLFAPPILAELRHKFPDQLPPSVRHVLVTKGFSPKAADEIIRLHRSNLEFLRAEGIDARAAGVVGPAGEAERHCQEKTESSELTPIRGREDSSFDRVLQFQIAENADARIHFRGRPTRASIRKLIALLDLSADTFPAV